MRCRIEQRTVIKSKPETKCHRIPREFCHKEDCKEAEDEVQNQNNAAESDDSLHPKCYFRQQIVSDNFNKHSEIRDGHKVVTNNGTQTESHILLKALLVSYYKYAHFGRLLITAFFRITRSLYRETTLSKDGSLFAIIFNYFTEFT